MTELLPEVEGFPPATETSRLCCCVTVDSNEREFDVSATGAWKVRNIDVLNLFHHPKPLKEFWLKWRNLELFYLLFGLSPAASVYFVIVFLPEDSSQSSVEFALAAYHVLCGLLPVSMFCNIDTIIHGLRQPGGFADLVVLIVAFVLGIVYGRGFVLLGSIGLVGSFQAAYFAPAYEVHTLLNHLNLRDQVQPKVFKVGTRIVYLILTIVLLWGRALIFLQVFTVRDEVMFTLRGIDIGVKDIWLVLVDVLYIRSVASTGARVIQRRADSLTLFAAQGRLHL